MDIVKLQDGGARPFTDSHVKRRTLKWTLNQQEARTGEMCSGLQVLSKSKQLHSGHLQVSESSGANSTYRTPQ